MAVQRDWGQWLRQQAAELRDRPATPEAGPSALALARALEFVEPDRGHAVAMYLYAFHAGSAGPEVLSYARSLCLEFGQLERAAEIATLEYRNLRDPRLLAVAGLTWLAAGEPASAGEALDAAARAIPDSELIAQAASACRGQGDGRTAIAELCRRAGQSTDSEAVERLLLAAALARGALGDAAAAGRLLGEAFARAPTHARTFALWENWLLEAQHREGLLAAYQQRVSAAKNALEVVDVCRRAGTRLALHGGFVGLAVRLLTESLRRAYRHRLEDIPGHVATLSLLRQHAETAQVLPDFLALLAEGLESASLSPPERLYVGIAGLETAWHRLRNARVAFGFASSVAAICPRHPLLAEYHQSGGLAQGAAGQRAGAPGSASPGALQASPAPASAPALQVADDDEVVYLDQVGRGQDADPNRASHPNLTGLALARASREQPAAVVPATAQVSAPARPSREMLVAAASSVQVTATGRTTMPGGHAPVAAPVPAAVRPPAPGAATPGAPAAAAGAVKLARITASRAAVPARASSPAGASAPAGAAAARAPAAPEDPGATPRHHTLDMSQQVLAAVLGVGAMASGEVPDIAAGALDELGELELDLGEPLPAAPRGSVIPQAALAALQSSQAAPIPRIPQEQGAVQRAARVRVWADVEVTLFDGSGQPAASFIAVTRDLSTTGAFLVCEAVMAVGCLVRLTVFLPGDATFGERQYLVMARVVRRTERGSGVQFEAPPAEFCAHLEALAGTSDG
jgi:tetratricopeptide (TPR) repeat protein